MGDQASQGLFSPLLQRARLDAAKPFLSGHVLDIGCGNGALAQFVDASRYTGIDRDHETLSVARSNFPHHTFSAEIPATRRYDTIIALALIEHLADPVGAVRAWASHLNDGGRIVMTTPHKSFHWVHDMGSVFGLFSKEAADEHETMFDRAGLNGLARAASLKLTDYRRFLLGANQLCIMARTEDDLRTPT